MITIRKATFTDKPAIFEFLNKAYKDKAQYKYPQRWEWQFEKNPFNTTAEIPVWLALNEVGTVVGHIGVMFEPLKMGTDSNKKTSWAVDLYVLPEYRNQKIGKRLTQAIYNDNDNLMALPMSEAFRHYITDLGVAPISPVKVFRRIAHFDSNSIQEAFRNRLVSNRLGRIFANVLHLICLDKLIAALINQFMEVSNKKSLAKYLNNVDITPLDKFGEDIDRLWEEISPGFDAIIQRKSKYLNWKYICQPEMNYQCFTLSKDGSLKGYLILRKSRPPEDNCGIIADLFASCEDQPTITTAIAYAIQYFKHENVKYIHSASSIVEFQLAYHQFGFKNIKVITPLIKWEKPARGSEAQKIPDKWFFSRSDHDWDQFPYA